MRILNTFRLFLATLLASLALGAQAQLSIEITGTGAARFPVIIPIFENEGRLPQSVTDVVRADLERSGLFTLIDTGPLPMPESVTPDLAAVRARGADAVLTGSLVPMAGGRHEVRFRLFDAQKQLELGAMALPMTPAQNRLVGHRIADFVTKSSPVCRATSPPASPTWSNPAPTSSSRSPTPTA